MTIVIHDHEVGAQQPPPMSRKRCLVHVDCAAVMAYTYSPTADPFVTHFYPKDGKTIPVRWDDLMWVTK